MAEIDRSKMRLGGSRFMEIFRPFLGSSVYKLSPPIFPPLFYISDEPEDGGDGGIEDLIEWLIAMDGTIIRTIAMGIGIGVPLLYCFMRSACESKNIPDLYRQLTHFSNIDFCKDFFEEKK